MTAHSLRALVGDLSVHGSADMRVEGVTADSRRVRPGFAFVVIRGADADGAEFVEAALAAGASAIVAEAGTLERIPTGVTVVEVASARGAIAAMSRRFHGDPDQRLRIAAATGTNGKTSVAHLTRDLLQDAGFGCGLLGTIAVDTGRRVEAAALTTPGPEDLYGFLGEMVEAGHQACAMEASSHALAQDRLGNLEVDAAAFTNLTRDHLDYHADAADYLAAKLRLLERLDGPARSKPAGRAVVYADDPVFAQQAWPAGTLRVGSGRDCDVRLVSHVPSREGIRLDLDLQGHRISAPTRLLGSFNVANLLLTVGVGVVLGLEPAAIESALPRLRPVPGRLEPVALSGGPLCLVDYAHTPDGIRSALEACRSLTSGRITIVFGCGGNRDRGKRPLMAAAAASVADHVILTLDNPRSEDPARIFADAEAGFGPGDSHQTIPDRHAAITAALRGSTPHDLVLVAGKGHETYQILADGKHEWDDRVAIREGWTQAREASS